MENTNVLRTIFSGPDGSFELLDFAPRFVLYNRAFKPSMLLRIIRPLEGDPRAIVRCRPVYDYGRIAASSWRSSNHIEYTGLGTPLRLTTNVPLTYVEDGRPFLLDRDYHLALTFGEPLEAGLEDTAERFLASTVEHWRDWVKRTRVPRDYQREVIRSALVLKLHQYEDTGALLAATTTSLPEHPGSGRTWDYRYCWLRDSYFTLNALERLGHATEMERFLVFLRNLAEERGGELQPVYTISGADEAEETELPHLAGYRGEQPVRIGNQAFHHLQNDVYGEMILAVSRLILDARFTGSIATPRAVELVGELLEQIETRLEDPDAGLWELRGVRRLHSFTLLMHWAGARRAAEIGEAFGRARPGRARRRSGGAGGRSARSTLLGRRARRHHPVGRRAGDRRGAPAQHPSRLSPARGSPCGVAGARDAEGARCRRRPAAALRRPRRLRASRRRRSRSAPSGSSRRSSRSAGGTRRRRCSTSCCPSETTSGSTARTSFPGRSSRAGTSPRPTATSA